MKNIIIVLSVVFGGFSINAQRTITLREAYDYNAKPEGIPEDVSYVKDTNKELDRFVGIWRGSYNGKTYEFRFEKKIQSATSIKWDVLIGRVLIKNSSNIIIYSTLNTPDNETYMDGYTFQRNTYMFHFFSVSTDYCNDSGVVFAEIKKDNPNKMRLYFDRDRTLYNPEKCPNYATYQTTLPENIELQLTKQ